MSNKSKKLMAMMIIQGKKKERGFW